MCVCVCPVQLWEPMTTDFGVEAVSGGERRCVKGDQGGSRTKGVSAVRVQVSRTCLTTSPFQVTVSACGAVCRGAPGGCERRDGWWWWW